MNTAFVEIEIYIGEGKHTPVWELICELLEDIGKLMPIVSNIVRKSPLKFQVYQHLLVNWKEFSVLERI